MAAQMVSESKKWILCVSTCVFERERERERERESERERERQRERERERERDVETAHAFQRISLLVEFGCELSADFICMLRTNEGKERERRNHTDN
jgi:hypothetical protein